MIVTVRGEQFEIDDEDYPIFSLCSWGFDRQKNGIIYLMHNLPTAWGTKLNTKFHRIVAGVVRISNGVIQENKDVLVDHIDGNTRNNRKSNLRLCTRSQNAMNCGKPSNNVSGYKGVSWKKDRRKWKAYYSINWRQYHVGYYDTAEEAAKAREQAAREAFGAFFKE
jgi:hypothetical protein